MAVDNVGADDGQSIMAIDNVGADAGHSIMLTVPMMCGYDADDTDMYG